MFDLTLLEGNAFRKNLSNKHVLHTCLLQSNKIDSREMGGAGHMSLRLKR